MHLPDVPTGEIVPGVLTDPAMSIPISPLNTPSNTLSNTLSNTPLNKSQVTASSIAASEIPSEYLFDILWHSPEALALTDPNGFTIDFANIQYCQMHGYAPGELNGQPIASLCPPAYHAELIDQIEHATEKGEHAWETWHLRKDGSAFPVWMKIKVIRDGQGLVKMRLVSAHDISQRKLFEDHARQMQNLLQAISDNSTAGISVKDRAGRYLLSNPLSDSALGVPPGGALGKTDYDIFPAAYADVFRANDLLVLETGVARETEESVPSLDADPAKDRTFLCLKFPLFDATGAAYATGLIATEITERKRMQQRLEDLTLRLRRAMQETHHRVKNNLQVIAALAEMQIDPEVAHLPRRAMLRIVQHIHALASLHDLLTEHARLDENAGVVSVKELFKKLLPLLRSLLEGRQIKVQMADLLFTSRMASAFALLVNELVSNAVKHGQGNIEITLDIETLALVEGKAKVETEAEEKDSQVETGLNEMVVFCVSDHGPGFPPDFDPQQVANTGLELIDSLVRYDLHGTVTYENRLPQGACIRVAFPMIPPTLKG